jgi:glutaredoxin 3
MNKVITIYSTEWCPSCKYLTNYLDSKGISYTKFDVEKDEDAFEEMLELSNGINSVPQINIDGEVHMIGFTKPKLDKILAL